MVSDVVKDPPEFGPGARVVLVTGGSQGIGAAVVRRLAARGVVVGCGYATSWAAAEALADEHPGVVPVPYSLGDDASAQAAVEQMVSTSGRLDAVIANAGTWAGGRLETLDPEEWSRVVRMNVEGTAQLCRAALPHLRSSPAGAVTIVSSVIGQMGGPGDTAYATAKAGLIGLAKSLAKEEARNGIRVNVVAPGMVATAMTAQVSDESRAAISRSILLGRFGTTEEVASAVEYLSEDATYCTGSILTVDGGWSL